MGIGYFQVAIHSPTDLRYYEVEDEEEWMWTYGGLHSSYSTNTRCSGDAMYLSEYSISQIAVF